MALNRSCVMQHLRIASCPWYDGFLLLACRPSFYPLSDFSPDMPRPIIGLQPCTAVSPSIAQMDGLGAAPSATGLKNVTLAITERLRNRRSPGYCAACQRLDAGTTTGATLGAESVLAAVAAEFPDLDLQSRPLGLVARCLLGAPFEVHTCALDGTICQHFRRGQSLPPLFERGRKLALHPSYAFIEVYPDTLRAIATDGRVSTIPG